MPKEDLHNYRRSYEKGILHLEDMDESPMFQFKKWFREAEVAEGFIEVNAMTLSTLGLDGFPKGRVVLLKQFDESGFYFYTNYKSEKGKSIEKNNHVCLSFFWPKMERQILIKGVAQKTSVEDSEIYFHSRPKGSQLGAIISNQSDVVESRKVLEDRLKLLELEFENKEIPKPEHWGGYLVTPVSIEFWQGRLNRLHDRILYTLKQGEWVRERLAP